LIIAGQAMGIFKGKRKRGLVLSLNRRKRSIRCCTSVFPSPSPLFKKIKHEIASPLSNIPRPFRRELSISKYISPLKSESPEKSRRKLDLENDQNNMEENISNDLFDLDNISTIQEEVEDSEYMSSILSILPDVLNELSMVHKKDYFIKLLESIKEGKLPLNNIAFELFLDVVNWFSNDDTRAMRYSPSTLKKNLLG
jgi:hypothetical protein